MQLLRCAERWRIRINAVSSNRKEVGDGSKGRCARSMKTFGEVISELRKERGLTQKAWPRRSRKRMGQRSGSRTSTISSTTAVARKRRISWRNWRQYWEFHSTSCSFMPDGSPRTRRRNVAILRTNRSWRPIARSGGSYRKSEETDHERAHLAQAPAAPGLFHSRAARRTV